MSEDLSEYKAELVDRYLQNQISNSEKDTILDYFVKKNLSNGLFQGITL